MKQKRLPPRRYDGSMAGRPGGGRFSKAKRTAIVSGVFFVLFGVFVMLLGGAFLAAGEGDASMVVLGVIFAGFGVWEIFFLDADADAARRAQRKQEKQEAKWAAREAALERRRSVPVKAVLVTAGMGQKNRLADGAAGYIVGGGLGMMAGMMGSKPKDKAVFYVTWSDGHATTETVPVNSPRFLELMKLTDA